MKYMIASDIHGSAYYCKKMTEAFHREKADRLLLLGDLLYHGPRNDLPRDYAPKEVIAMLNGLSRQIFCVRGNCEAEVDQMVLSFPVLADYCVIPVENRLIYATHGHHHNTQTPPPLQQGDILLPWSHPYPGMGKLRGGQSLSESRLGLHPEGAECAQLYDFGRE